MARLTKLSPEKLSELRNLRGGVKTADDIAVTPEMYFLAEFGYYFGWPGVLSLENDEIGLDKAQQLLAAARKVWYLKLYEQSLGNFYASKDSKTFDKGIKAFVKKMKVNS